MGRSQLWKSANLRSLKVSRRKASERERERGREMPKLEKGNSCEASCEAAAEEASSYDFASGLLGLGFVRLSVEMRSFDTA